MATAPPPEPISLEQVKQYRRVLGNHEDEVYARLIRWARDYVETAMGLFLVQRQTTERYRPVRGEIRLNYGPLVSVDRIEYEDGAGVFVPYLAPRFIAGSQSVLPAWGGTWPTLQRGSHFHVTYTAGFAPGKVPENLIQAMHFLIGHGDANREGVVVGTISKEVELGVKALLRGHWRPIV